MSPAALSRGAAAFLGFGRLLRRYGFPVAPEQISGFMQAVTLLGPRSMTDIHEAALATLAPPPDRRDEFEAHFRSHFYGDGEALVEGDSDEETRIKDDGETSEQEIEVVRQEQGGELSSASEQLSVREFQRDGDRLAAFRRKLATALPARRSFRTCARMHAASSTCAARCAKSSVPTAISPRRCCAGGRQCRASFSC
ncbi:hypothetical protein [Mesorhizobium sp. ISC25]|uniref:hypothetical protein n=1 Tax=Mesorhizobium sp. ISC25 TaxID=3077335 RepID=UPI0035D9B0D6